MIYLAWWIVAGCIAVIAFVILFSGKRTPEQEKCYKEMKEHMKKLRGKK